MTTTGIGDVEISSPHGAASEDSPSAADTQAAKTQFSGRAAYEELARWTRRRLTILVLIGVVIVFAWWLCNSVVSDTWYHARQRQLATEFGEAQRHLTVGKAAAILQVPRLGTNILAVEGAGPTELRSGPGHLPTSPLPGTRGNSVIVGHKSTWGSPFGDLHELHRGDIVDVKIRPTKRGGPAIFFYKVTKTETIKNDDERPFGSSKDFRLTLATSNGGVLGGDRFVVVAVSGTESKARLGRPQGEVPPSEDLIDPLPVVVAVVGFLAAWMLVTALRRRRRSTLTILVVVAPVLFGAVLATYLELDRLLPPLR
jgi:sortase A